MLPNNTLFKQRRPNRNNNGSFFLRHFSLVYESLPFLFYGHFFLKLPELISHPCLSNIGMTTNFYTVIVLSLHGDKSLCQVA